MEQENIFESLEISNTETNTKVANIQIREAKTKVKKGKKVLNFWVEQLRSEEHTSELQSQR